MLGLWAAGKRGEAAKAAEDYARALIEADIGAPDAAFNKLVRDLAGHGIEASEIRQKQDALLAIVLRASA
jgi:hypothetical protein